MDKPIQYSTVESYSDIRPVRVRSTWKKLVKRLSTPVPRGKATLAKYLSLPRKARAEQKNGPGWIPATFVPGGKRNDASLQRLYLFIGDCDNTRGREVSLESLRRSLKGYEAVIHTTYSHSRAKPKFRFVLPLKRPISPDDHVKLFNYFDAKLGGSLDLKGKTPSQLYYWPSYPRDAGRLFSLVHLRGAAVAGKKLASRGAAIRDKPLQSISTVKLDGQLPKVDIADIQLSKHIRSLIVTGESNTRTYGSRSEAIYAVVIALISRGLADSQIASILLNRDYQISEKIREQQNPRRYITTTLKKARSASFIGDAATIDEAVAGMNSKHAVVSVGGRCVILTEGRDPVLHRHEVTLSYLSDLQLKYGNKNFIVNEKSVNVVDIWVKHEQRRQYDRIVFAPQEEVPNCYNLWRGFAVKPKQGDCGLYLSHIRDNIAQGDEDIYRYVLGFMADAVQNPARLPGVALVMRGDEGVGKGVLAAEFGKLFGQHFVPVYNSRHLVGNFNAHLKDALLVFADEAFFAGEKSSQGVLNAIITEPTRVLEHKGKDPVTVPNFVRLMMASNHDWVVPAGATARRFFVIDVSNRRIQDRVYFSAIRTQMNTGGRAALLQLLLEYDLSNFDVAAFPRTSALFDQQVRSMQPEEKFWYERLKRGELTTNAGRWTGIIRSTTLWEEFILSAQKMGVHRRAAETELGMTLHKLCPVVKKVRRRIDGTKRKASYYIFPDLARCRELLSDRLRIEIDWSKP